MKRMGQHFLRDPAILDRIVDALDPVPDDVVLEIGAGEGTLTARLAPRVGRIVTIEKDRRLVAALAASRQRGGLPGHVTIVDGDALRLDWGTLLDDAAVPGQWKLIGNVPYQITTPLIQRALTPPMPSRVVFLVQREVADRLVATPGGKTYGALSVGVQAAARVERLFAVRPGSFAPPPAVDSAVVRLIPRPDPLVPTEQTVAFRGFVTGVFGQRRRQIQRGLRTVLGWSPDRVRGVLDAVGLPADARPETLSPEAFASLFQVTLVD